MREREREREREGVSERRARRNRAKGQPTGGERAKSKTCRFPRTKLYSRDRSTFLASHERVPFHRRKPKSGAAFNAASLRDWASSSRTDDTDAQESQESWRVAAAAAAARLSAAASRARRPTFIHAPSRRLFKRIQPSPRPSCGWGYVPVAR